MSIKNIAEKAKTPKSLRWYVPNWNGDDVPYIDHLPANVDNPRYMSARLKFEKSSEGMKLTRGQMTLGKIDAMREADFAIYAETVVTGWGGFFDDDGKPFEFKAGDLPRIQDLLRALGSANFDDLRKSAQSPSQGAAAEGRQELAGNS